MATTTLPRNVRHRDFYRGLEEILHAIDLAEGLESMLTTILERVSATLADGVGITSGRLYRDESDQYVIVRSFGAKGKEVLGQAVPRDYAPLAGLGTDEVRMLFDGDPRVDVELEQSLGVDNFVVFYVGITRQYLAAFGFSSAADPQEVMLTMNTLRYAIAHRLRELDFEGQLREAREIQLSSLPDGAPQFAGFELAARSQPAEQVGGDILDFLPIDDHLIGLAMGDASGHGLPAALQARDVITGLRMAVERDLKITAVIRRLNRVIHRGTLSSRFVSLLYGELESNGNFVYVNAGHDPGIVLRVGGEREQLQSTGLVLGPVAELQFRRELVHLEVGDVLLLYTDGVTERLKESEPLGLEGLLTIVRELLDEGGSFAEIPMQILERVFEYGQRAPWLDDVSVLLVRRVEADARRA